MVRPHPAYRFLEVGQMPASMVAIVSENDRRHWDARYREIGMAPADSGPPPVFATLEHLFPTSGNALDLACGRGRGAVWLAGLGLSYFGVDVSPVAIDLATSLASANGIEERCRFAVHDLDVGLPAGPEVDLLFCYLFRDPALDLPIVERLAPGGVLAIAVLSEVQAGPGPFRAVPGELTDAFSSKVEVLNAGEGDGMAWLIGTKP